MGVVHNTHYRPRLPWSSSEGSGCYIGHLLPPSYSQTTRVPGISYRKRVVCGRWVCLQRGFKHPYAPLSWRKHTKAHFGSNGTTNKYLDRVLQTPQTLTYTYKKTYSSRHSSFFGSAWSYISTTDLKSHSNLFSLQDGFRSPQYQTLQEHSWRTEAQERSRNSIQCTEKTWHNNIMHVSLHFSLPFTSYIINHL